MMASVKLGRRVALTCMAALVAACTTTRDSSWETTGEASRLDDAAQAQVAELLNQANAAWDQRTDRKQAKAAIDALKAATDIDPSDAEALTNLSHAIYFYADCHLRWDDSKPDLYKGTHEEGVEYAERALSALSPEFADAMAGGARIEEAIEFLDSTAVPALYWRSSNLGRWAVLESFATLLSYKDETRAVMEFCLAENPGYWYQGPDRYFGVFYARTPSFAGGDMRRAAEHFNASIEAQPDYWGTRTLMAEEWAVKEDNRALYEQLINYVLEGDPEVIPYIKPENLCEQRKAQKLKDQIDDYF